MTNKKIESLSKRLRLNIDNANHYGQLSDDKNQSRAQAARENVYTIAEQLDAAGLGAIRVGAHWFHVDGYEMTRVVQS